MRGPVTNCLLSWLLITASVSQAADLPKPRVSILEAGPNFQYELQARLIDAVPGDVIEFRAGRYELHRQLDVTTSHLTIRGAGSDKTILSFQGQAAGGAGLEATGNNLLLEGFAVEDTAGNAIKVLGANGVTFRDIRAEWTGPASSSNGAYGLYPVQCRNVLIERCTVIGASDAGIYVGQSRNVIVRSCRAERNVAGFEIENTVGADVYENTATNNTGGILVFDLPGLQLKAGRNVRVYENQVYRNNHTNFAAKGNIVASVPAGMGVMVMATDSVEVFRNRIDDHRTAGVTVIAYQGNRKRKKKRDTSSFDPYPESISIYENEIVQSGYSPLGEMAPQLAPLVGGNFPDIFWDGIVDPQGMQDGKPSRSQIPSIRDNGAATLINFDLPHANPADIAAGVHQIRRDLAAHDLPRERLPAIRLEKPSPIQPEESAAVLVYRSAKQKLSDYGLFAGELAEQKPAADVYAYDLNTPLFSDYTSKYRFFRIPAGTTIQYSDQGTLEFPVGTVISKTFAYPIDMTAPERGERLLETRIEFRQEGGWYGFSYLWNDEQTEATLALGGSELEVSWIHSDGKQRRNHYLVPNANQCLNCHQQGERFEPLGPVVANLNRKRIAGEKNQLQDWSDRGLLVGAPPELDQVVAWPEPGDAEHHSIDRRARSWMHVNCAHCHNPIGTARTSGLDLRLTQHDPAKFGVHKVPVAAGHGSGGRSYDIVPGKPDESILLYRIESEDPSIAMPSVGRNLVPIEAAELIRQWIREL